MEGFNLEECNEGVIYGSGSQVKRNQQGMEAASTISRLRQETRYWSPVTGETMKEGPPGKIYSCKGMYPLLEL